MNILHRTSELDREGGFCNTGGRCEDPPAHSSDHLSNSNDSSDTSICTAPNDSNGSNSWRGSSTPNGLFDSAPSPVVSHSPAMEEIHVVLYEGPNRVPLSSPHCTTCSFLFIGLDYDDMNLASTNFSLVCVLDPPTLFTLPRLEQMWSGPISVALLAPVNESQFKMLSSRTRVAVVHSSLPKSLNYLRNIAINNTLRDRCGNDRRFFSSLRSPIAPFVLLNALDRSHSPSFLPPVIALLFIALLFITPLEGLPRERGLLGCVLSVPFFELQTVRIAAALQRNDSPARSRQKTRNAPVFACWQMNLQSHRDISTLIGSLWGPSKACSTSRASIRFCSSRF